MKKITITIVHIQYAILFLMLMACVKPSEESKKQNLPEQSNKLTSPEEKISFSYAAAREYHTFVIKKDGTLHAWGYNNKGQLGIGNTTDQHEPQQVGTNTNWKAISAGMTHSLALKQDATLYAWGYNNKGQLGIGNTTDQHAPQQV